MGRPISGSLTPASADVTCSVVGSGEFMPLMLRRAVHPRERGRTARGA
jgi:hypothetical protein